MNMKQYYKLNYIFWKNKMYTNLLSLDICALNNFLSGKAEYFGFKFLFGFWSVIKFFCKKVIWYGLLIPLFSYVVLSLINAENIQENFLIYYYYALLLFQIAAKITKSQIMRADEIEYYYLKIFRYPKEKFIRLKKTIAISEMLFELLVVGCVMGSMKYRSSIIIGTLFTLALIDFVLSSLFIKLLCLLKSKYLKLKYSLVILTNILVPFGGLYFVSTYKLKLYPLSMSAFVICGILIIGMIIFLYRMGNEKLLCQLILQQYYYDNALLESLDKDKFSVTAKPRQKTKTGYAYFNYIFFYRHKGIILKNCFAKMFLIIGVAIGFRFVVESSTLSQWKWLMSILPFLLYQLSISSKICGMFWRNCDINMTKQIFYKSAKTQAILGKYRLLSLLTINTIFSLFCSLIFVGTLKVQNYSFSISDTFTIICITVIVMALHAVLDFIIYYRLKPYENKNMSKVVAYLVKTLYLLSLGAILFFFI